MNFLSELHRSIFDPYFYREALKKPWGRAALFLVKLIMLTALVMCVSKTHYLVHSERGIAPLVSALFAGMEIREGRLATELPQPVAMPGDPLTEIMNRVMGYPRFFSGVPDGFMVVDAKGGRGGGAAKIVLKEYAVEFPEMRIEMPYAALIGGGGDFQFTVPAVQAALNGNVVAFALGFLMTSLFFGTFTAALSVFFLSLAAYIFRAERERGYSDFLRLACYSISPVLLGDALVSVSGVSAEWMWHVLIVVSTVIMFRAMTRVAAEKASVERP